LIDELLLFNRALTAEEVAGMEIGSGDEKAASGKTMPEGLVAHWSFENNVNDVSAQGNDGSLRTLLASMDFANDGRLFFSEKNTGNIRIMKDEVILDEPFAHLSDVYVSWEQGLLGLTLDSKFDENHFVYQYYTVMDPSTGEVFNRLVRFKEVNDKGTEMKILLDRIPGVKGYHSGGAIAFGPDDKLYVTVGDATEHPFAQDLNVLVGKVLRIERDGGIPSDNPDPNSPIYTRGHRNTFGLAFDNNGLGIITENGEAAYDEINVIRPGGNYGFPTFQPANIAPELADPTLSLLPARSYFETIAPTQAVFYDGEKIPQLKNRFLFGTFTGDIFALEIDPESKLVIGEERIDLFPILFTPVIGIAQAPNGEIYYGSYSIYKLESLDLSTRKAVSYPIQIAATKGLQVKDLEFDQDRRRIALDVVSSLPSATGGNISSQLVSVKVPRTLMDEITDVMEEDENYPLPFVVSTGGGSSSVGGYSVVTLKLDDVNEESQVSVIAARVIPEFPIAGIVMTVTLVSIISFVTLARRVNMGWMRQ
jgi:glucose/arabinose dehydrogenase